MFVTGCRIAASVSPGCYSPVMRPGDELVMKRIESAATSTVIRLLRRLVTGSEKAMSPEPGALKGDVHVMAM